MAWSGLINNKTVDICIEDVKNIDDFEDVMNRASELDVDLDELNSLEEMKERLVMALEKSQSGYVNFKTRVCSRMSNLKRDDHNKREKLYELLITIEQKLSSTNIIEESLQTEGIVKNLQEELAIRKKSMKTGDCCFVVAGETTAGKSLFLNLLLGEDLLPSCFPPCTSVITRLSYNKHRHARIVYRDKHREDDVFEDFKYEDINHILNEENYKRRDVTSEIKEVSIHLPAKILKTGLVLVDTPGVGENEDMDKVIETFVEENQVMGFVYIIKSDAGGGVDEDRLIRLIKIILQKEKSKSESNAFRFNPRCAMFVCNKWDTVTEPDKVYTHIVQRLSKIWPQFDEQKLIRFSAYCAMRDTKIDEDYINTEYKHILEVLHSVYSEAINERIKVTYKWIKTILLRSVHHIKTIVRQLNSSDNRMEADTNKALRKLEKLKTESTKIITSLRTTIDKTSQNICDEFREHLKSPVTAMTITQWIAPELPHHTSEDEDGHEVKKDWGQLKTEIDERIIDKITDQLVTWEEENGIISDLEALVVTEIRENLLGMTKEMQQIEQQMDNSSSTGSTDVTDSTSGCRRSHTNTTLNQNRRESVNMQTIQRMRDDKYHLSTFAKMKLLKPFSSTMKKMIPRTNRLKCYASDKVGYAKKRSEKLLKKFTDPCKNDNDFLKLAIDCFMEGAIDTLDQLIQEIPGTIRANENLIKHAALYQRDALASRRHYEELMKDFEMLKRLMADYGAGYIFVDDFKPNELQVLDPTDKTGRSSFPFKISEFLMNMSASQTNYTTAQCPRALWTVHQKGLLKRQHNEELVTIKVYLPSCKMEKCYSEIAKWRLLEHKNIAVFLGIQHSDSYLPAMVYKGHLHTLRHHILKRSKQLDIPVCVQEIVAGMEYLHKNGMVHMELNTNTVMIGANCCVQLTGGCLPRRADLPDDPEQHVCGDFIYLAPEVLKGDLYIPCADVYAFGLLIFELLVSIISFSNQRKMSLDLFVQNVDPYKMMNFEESLSLLDDSVKDLIISCVEQTEGSRPTVSALREIVTNMKLENTVDRTDLSHIPLQAMRFNDGESGRL